VRRIIDSRDSGSAGLARAIELLLHCLERLGDGHEQVSCFLVEAPRKLVALEGEPQRLFH
jgi:hypothetical protein